MLVCKGFFQFAAEQAAIAAVAGEQARRADNADMPGAVEQPLVRAGAELLQAGQADIHTQHTNNLIALNQWEGDAGHQGFHPVSIIDIGVKQAHLFLLQRAAVPGVIGRATEARSCVTEIFFGHGLGAEFAIMVL